MSKPVEKEDLQEALTVTQIAKLCRVNRVTVTRWIHKGLIPAIQPPTGKPFFVRKEDFVKFFNGYRFAKPKRKEGAHEEGQEKSP